MSLPACFASPETAPAALHQPRLELGEAVGDLASDIRPFSLAALSAALEPGDLALLLVHSERDEIFAMLTALQV